jgi:hypothetical protein
VVSADVVQFAGEPMALRDCCLVAFGLSLGQALRGGPPISEPALSAIAQPRDDGVHGPGRDHVDADGEHERLDGLPRAGIHRDRRHH